MWEVLMTDEWAAWYGSLGEAEQDSLLAGIELLRRNGPMLTRPYADTIRNSKHANMRELRTQHAGRPLRSLYAFDYERKAILLCGGDKTGDDRFYDRMIPLADQLFTAHLNRLDRK